MERIAKAWRVKCTWSDDWDIVHAETASKARYRLRCDLSDCYPDLRFDQIIARRSPEHDRTLPAEHRVVADLTTAEREIIMHAFGASNRRDPGYRNHYCTQAGDTRLLRLAWEFGIFRGPYGEEAYGDTPGWVGSFFYLTDFGKHVARSMLPTYQ
jgi:hypothetical protein